MQFWSLGVEERVRVRVRVTVRVRVGVGVNLDRNDLFWVMMIIQWGQKYPSVEV